MRRPVLKYLKNFDSTSTAKSDKKSHSSASLIIFKSKMHLPTYFNEIHLPTHFNAIYDLDQMIQHIVGKLFILCLLLMLSPGYCEIEVLNTTEGPKSKSRHGK